MPHRSPLRLAAATVCSAALLLILAVPAGAVTTLRLGGIGPLELGMKRSAALATGWLGNRGTGCELGGDPLPITYRFTGPSAPRGLVGTAEFRRHRLRNLAFSRGVRTGRGVRVRVTTTSRMVSRYDAIPGFGAHAQFVGVFGGTFVTVRHHGRTVLGAFSDASIIDTLAIPFVPTCE